VYFDFSLSSCYTKKQDSDLLHANSVDVLHPRYQNIDAYFKISVMGLRKGAFLDVTFSGLN